MGKKFLSLETLLGLIPNNIVRASDLFHSRDPNVLPENLRPSSRNTQQKYQLCFSQRNHRAFNQGLQSERILFDPQIHIKYCHDIWVERKIFIRKIFNVQKIKAFIQLIVCKRRKIHIFFHNARAIIEFPVKRLRLFVNQVDILFISKDLRRFILNPFLPTAFLPVILEISNVGRQGFRNTSNIQVP